MTLQDAYLLAPEIAIAGLALIVILLDLVFKDKRIIFAVAILGLFVPLSLTWMLLGDVQACQNSAPDGFLVDSCSGGHLTAIFGTLAVDQFALFFKTLVLAIVFIVFLGSIDYIKRIHSLQGEFYTLILLSTLGAMLLPATTELVSIYISLELIALPLVALATFLRDSRSSEAGMKFLVLGAISSALLLYGMALVLAYTGSTDLKVIASATSESKFGSDTYALFLGVVLILAGFGFKVGFVPFQMWIPDVYEGAPTPVTAYLSVASKAAGFAIMIRVFLLVFGQYDLGWETLFIVLSTLSMFVGNFVAITQNNIKRMLAYSTIAQAGYMLIGVTVLTDPVFNNQILGASSILFYLAGYAITNLAAFFAIIIITDNTGSEEIDSLTGMGKRAPIISAILAISMLSLIGIPPTVGFMGKLYLFNAAIQTGLVWIVVIGVLNSVLSAYYYVRVIRKLYSPSSDSLEKIRSSLPVRLAVGLAGLGVVGFGILPGPVIHAAKVSVKAVLVGL